MVKKTRTIESRLADIEKAIRPDFYLAIATLSEVEFLDLLYASSPARAPLTLNDQLGEDIK